MALSVALGDAIIFGTKMDIHLVHYINEKKWRLNPFDLTSKSSTLVSSKCHNVVKANCIKLLDVLFIYSSHFLAAQASSNPKALENEMELSTAAP